MIKKNIPDLRFPEFNDIWKERKIKEITQRYVNPVEVETDIFYREIGIRSHGKGLFHKSEVLGRELGNKRVFWIKENAFIVNIVFAWEQAIGKTSEKEIGMIASHRFPMYIPRDNKSSVDFLLYYFLTPKGKSLLELASPGGAGRNKTLGQKEFDNVKFYVPLIQEQQKIVSFLNSIDKKIQQLEKKKNLLEHYKEGIMQKIFSQEIRFRDENGTNYSNWEKKKLGEVFSQNKGRDISKSDIIDDGVNPCILYGELYTTYSEVISKIKSYTNSNGGLKSKINDLLLPSSTTTTGIDLVNFTALNIENVQLGGDIIVLRQKEFSVNNRFFAYYLSNHKKTEIASKAQGITIIHLYYNSIKDIIIDLPALEEQSKIADFLTSIDSKIESINTEINNTKEYKKGLMQKMFV